MVVAIDELSTLLSNFQFQHLQRLDLNLARLNPNLSLRKIYRRFSHVVEEDQLDEFRIYANGTLCNLEAAPGPSKSPVRSVAKACCYRIHAHIGMSLSYGQLKLSHKSTVLETWRVPVMQSLQYHGKELFKRNLPEESMQATKGSVQILRELAALDAAKYSLLLADTLSAVQNTLVDLQHHKEAFECGKEEVELIRVLAGKDLLTYGPRIVYSLQHMGSRYSKLGQLAEALQCRLEVVDIERKMIKQSPKVSSHFRDKAPSGNFFHNVSVVISERH